MINVVLFGGGWFVSAIMVYYIIFYMIKKWFMNKLYIPISTIVLLLITWCVFIHDSSDFSQIYSSGNFSSRIIGFFNMLLGACIGMYSKTHKTTGGSAWAYGSIAIISVVIYYGTLYVCGKYPSLHVAQVLSIIPMTTLIYSLYRLFNTETIQKMYNMHYIHAVVYFVGSLCLEMYICQFVLITNKFNNLFPLNVLLFFPIVVFVAYGLRIVSRIFSQTFKNEDYNWKIIFNV